MASSQTEIAETARAEALAASSMAATARAPSPSAKAPVGQVKVTIVIWGPEPYRLPAIDAPGFRQALGEAFGS